MADLPVARPVLTDVEIDVAINAYEQRARTMLNRATRSKMRILARLEPTTPRPARHPLGHDSDPTEDQCTAPNRAAVRACLAAYWSGTLATQLNQGKDAATGMMLSDRLVSLLEIGTSFQILRLDYPDLALLLERRYRDGWTKAQVCQAEHYSLATYYRRETEAIDVLIGWIYRDWIAERPRPEPSLDVGLDT